MAENCLHESFAIVKVVYINQNKKKRRKGTKK